MRVLVRAVVGGTSQQVEAQQAELAGSIADFNVLSHLAGRVQLIREAVSGGEPRTSRALQGARLPAVPFDAAIADLQRRDPVIAADAEELAQLYREGPVFGMSKTASLGEIAALEVTNKARAALVRLQAGEITRPAAEQVIEELGPWGRSYAQNVIETNFATTSTAGRFDQARKMGPAFPALQFLTAEDSDVRDGKNSSENHAALDGIIAAVDSPFWNTWRPPLGYRCRCRVRLVSRAELERKGLIDAEGNLAPEVLNPRVPPGARKSPRF
jgi:SPP1 gp7 family putative phage head morphogenesis protein